MNRKNYMTSHSRSRKESDENGAPSVKHLKQAEGVV